MNELITIIDKMSVDEMGVAILAVYLIIGVVGYLWVIRYGDIHGNEERFDGKCRRKHRDRTIQAERTE